MVFAAAGAHGEDTLLRRPSRREWIMPNPSDETGAADPQRIDAAFRNGSVTAVGIILGFSLGFLSQWASNPIS
jgi:hypothetical protein